VPQTFSLLYRRFSTCFALPFGVPPSGGSVGPALLVSFTRKTASAGNG